MSQEGTQQAFGGCIDANSDNKTEASLLAAKFAEDHYDEVFRYCARRLPSREDAQDATQEVFLRLVKARPFMNGTASRSLISTRARATLAPIFTERLSRSILCWISNGRTFPTPILRTTLNA